MIRSIIFSLAFLFSKFGAAETTLPDYNNWAFKVIPLEFRGGNHKSGKPSVYHVTVSIVASERGLNPKFKKDFDLITLGPIETNSLAWRAPTESEIENSTVEVLGDDVRKSISQAMAETNKPEDQVRIEVRLTAFIKPLIPYIQKPEILGVANIVPEEEIRGNTPFQKEINLGLGGLLKFKILPTGGPKKK
jgi:hypothetical protein